MNCSSKQRTVLFRLPVQRDKQLQVGYRPAAVTSTTKECKMEVVLKTKEETRTIEIKWSGQGIYGQLKKDMSQGC